MIRSSGQYEISLYDLAAAYAFLGKKREAYQNLHEFEKKKFIPFWGVKLIERDPLFDGIRNEQEFMDILKNIEAKYSAEHERVTEWMKKNEMTLH